MKILSKDLEKELNKALKEDVEISMKRENGECTIMYVGNTLAILIALASLEDSILKGVKHEKGLYEFIKANVITEEVDDEQS